GAGAHRTGQPVDGVLQDGGNGAVVLGGEQQQGVGTAGGLTQAGGGGRDAALRVDVLVVEGDLGESLVERDLGAGGGQLHGRLGQLPVVRTGAQRSEEHTSELQSRENLVCRLLLEK